jgi:uncharacterized protein YjiS (DUF1127 family)
MTEAAAAFRVEQAGKRPIVAGQCARSRNLAFACVRLIAIWMARARERRDLATLDDRMLRDIGITRIDVLRECRKPFWR